jgi:heme A synthase
MSIIEVHGRLANTAIFYTAIMAIWGLWRYFRKQEIDSSYFGALVIAEILFVIQGLLGAYIFISGIGHLSRAFMHILYGVVTVLVIPAVFAYTRGDNSRRVQLIYGIALLFLVAILFRSLATGG